MKTLFYLFIISLFTLKSSSAQSTDAEKIALYPKQYTFEKAQAFLKKEEYEKAIWFYINLFPNNKMQVVEIIKTLAIKQPKMDVRKSIKKSFVLYGTFDPAITAFEGGDPTMDIAKLKLKGAWADELIQKIYNPDDPLAAASEYNFKGLEKAKEGNFKGAIEDFDKAINIKESGQIYYNRAYSKSMIEDFNGAIQDFDKTINFKYRLAEAYFESGYCKDQLNNPEGAIADYTKAIEINKDYAEAYNNRAFTMLKQQNYTAAIEDFDNAIKIKPDFVGAYVNRGFAKKGVGDKPGACKDWSKAVSLGHQEANKFLTKNCK